MNYRWFAIVEDRFTTLPSFMKQGSVVMGRDVLTLRFPIRGKDLIVPAMGDCVDRRCDRFQFVPPGGYDCTQFRDPGSFAPKLDRIEPVKCLCDSEEIEGVFPERRSLGVN